MINKNKIQNLQDPHHEEGRNTHHIHEKPKLEIQVDSIIQNHSGFKCRDKEKNLLKMKDSCPNTLDIESDCKDISNSETKTKKTEMSKNAQMLMDRLKISKPTKTSYAETSINALRNMEEEKGNFMHEQFDQSRPMTTRIYDSEDDQQLFMQYKNISTPKPDQNKHMSVEAGLERISKENFNDENDNALNDFENDQNSVIIKNINDEDEDYAFASQIETPDHEFSKYDEDNNDEDVMTVIEKDCDNGALNI